MALIDTAKIGKLGGKARAHNLSTEELSAIGRKGAAARWPKKAAADKKTKRTPKKRVIA
jgi:hypothetical protein